MKHYLLLLTLALSFQANACNSHSAKDEWHGKDKVQHFSLSIPLGAMGAYIAKDTEHPIIYGTLIGSVPGLLKEISDGCRKNGSGFSTKDLAFDVLGSFVGASFGNYAINYFRTPSGSNGIYVSYRTEF